MVSEVTGQRPVVRGYVARFAEPEGLVSFKNRLNEGAVENAGGYSSDGCMQDSEVTGQRPVVRVDVARFAEPEGLVSFKNRLKEGAVENTGGYSSNRMYARF